MCGEREMRMTLNYWLYLLCGHCACGGGMSGFSEEGRGLSFSLIGAQTLRELPKSGGIQSTSITALCGFPRGAL